MIPYQVPAVVQEAKIKDLAGHMFYKIHMEGHTYTYIRNLWNAAGSYWEHDVECEKCKENKLNEKK